MITLPDLVSIGPPLTARGQSGTLLAMTEDPGGSTGCDVCGVLLVADKVSLHNEWHRIENERLEGFAQTLRNWSRRCAAVALDHDAALSDP
jgi:hypothetical protein